MPRVAAHRAAHAEPLLLAPDDAGAFGGGPYADDDVDGCARLGGRRAVAGHGRRGVRADADALPPDAFDLAGFDWNRMAAAGVLDLALHGHDDGGG